MRHGKKFNHLGRKKGHRKALLKNLSNALIEHKRINTTLAKAKALRLHLEPLVTKAKTNTTHSRRVVFSYLQNKEAVTELFGNVATTIGDRPGGYLRIIKTGFRKGDAAEMAMIEFVDFNTVYSNDKTSSGTGKKKTRRRGKGKGKGAASAAAATATAAVVADEVIEETSQVTETVTDAAQGDDPEFDALMNDTVEESGRVVNEVADNDAPTINEEE